MYKTGDRLKCINIDNNNGFGWENSLTLNKIYIVTELNNVIETTNCVYITDNNNRIFGYRKFRFTKAFPTLNKDLKIL